MQAVRPRLCAVRGQVPRLLQRVHGQGRQGGRQAIQCGLQGVRQKVFRKDQHHPILLGRVPRRGGAQARPREHAAVPGRPREARRRAGANEGQCRGPKGQGEEGAAEAGAWAAEACRPRHGTPAERRAGRQVAGLQAVRLRLRAVRRYRQPCILQEVHGQGRSRGRQGLAHPMRTVRQGVFRDPPPSPILLGCMPHRWPATQ